MARMTITVCLFFSIFILSNLASPVQASMVFVVDDLLISIDKLLLIPESEEDWCGEQSDLRWETLIFPACRIADPRMISNPVTDVETEIATCPIESKAGVETRNANDSADSCLSPRAVWGGASRFLSVKKAIIIRSLDSIDRTFCRGYRWLSQSADQTLRSISWSDVQESSITSAKKLVPSILMSQYQSTSESDSFCFPDNRVEETMASESWAVGESLIGLTGKIQDSYWQYYEDCDRWDVDFANLLLEADISVPSREIEQEAIEESNVRGISPQCLIFRIVAAQNLSNWLYRSPRIEKQASVGVSRWMEFVKLSYLEGAETVSVRILHTATLCSPRWNFVSEIIQSVGIDSLMSPMSSLEAIHSSTNN